MVKKRTVRTVLLVEDDERARGIYLGRLAELPGLEVVAPASHEETVLAFKKSQYDVLLLDGSLWGGTEVLTHEAAIRAQLAGGAVARSISSDDEESEVNGRYFRVPKFVGPWGKRRVRIASTQELSRALCD